MFLKKWIKTSSLQHAENACLPFQRRPENSFFVFLYRGVRASSVCVCASTKTTTIDTPPLHSTPLHHAKTTRPQDHKTTTRMRAYGMPIYAVARSLCSSGSQRKNVLVLTGRYLALVSERILSAITNLGHRTKLRLYDYCTAFVVMDEHEQPTPPHPPARSLARPHFRLCPCVLWSVRVRGRW